MTQFRITIPNDYGNETDSAALNTWCEAHDIPCEYDAVLDAAIGAWPGAEAVGVLDFGIIAEAPAAPPEDDDAWPPLWVEPKAMP